MKKIYTIMAALLFSVTAFAQIETPVKWAYAAKKVSSTEAVLLIKATIEEDWHIYSQNVKPGGPIATAFTFSPAKTYALVGKPTEPKPITKYEPVSKMNVSYFENSVVFQQKIKIKPGLTSVKGKVEFMTCNDRKCLPPDEVEFSIPVK